MASSSEYQRGVKKQDFLKEVGSDRGPELGLESSERVYH